MHSTKENFHIYKIYYSPAPWCIYTEVTQNNKTMKKQNKWTYNLKKFAEDQVTKKKTRTKTKKQTNNKKDKYFGPCKI